MPLPADPLYLTLLAALLAATGGVAGVLAGLLGVGGGIVIVPVLYHLFAALGIEPEVRMHVAVATSLATIVLTSISSARAHWRRGSIDVDLLKSWGPWIFLGVLAGTALAVMVEGRVLSAVFAVVALAVAADMAFRPEGTALFKGLPRGPARVATAGTIGAVSAMMGIGGGTLSVPTLSLCRFPIRRAVGTASAIGLIIAVPAVIGFLSSGHDVPGRPPLTLGYVNLLGFALIVPATVLSAPLGARLAHAISPLWLRRAFALFLALTGGRMMIDLLG
ncbi:sulfite exporter TauE/SafE family protein [Roseospirillum parvum]|uniref:Probable membrane transporter protein n=1 Tax=Roseospirillum parvum TaxID=83401 RepID=A0A1G8D3J8_9PROT|nr:sulfite exporter TauE/SafE family protein [Roseospirillum parvum]SDH51969.1 Uncharacterized membrane protein YfcA [Roseospirillum parvum]